MLALFGAARKAAGTNVEMRKSNELISRFLEWSQGLKTTYVEEQALLRSLSIVFGGE